jgi:phage shock protein C
MNDRLYRSVDDRVIAGVCGGLAVRMDLDPSLVRIGYAILALVTGVFPLLVLYVVMAAVIPEEPTGFAGVGRAPVPPGPDAMPGWTSPAGEPAASTASVDEAGAGQPAPTQEGGFPQQPGAPSPAPGAGSPQWATQPTWSRRDARRERRERRRSDPMFALFGGLVLVGLGVYFLVRDQVSIDWTIVWAVGLMALGAVVIVAAFARPRR